MLAELSQALAPLPMFVVDAVAVGYVVSYMMSVAVASLHHDPATRADARKVLERNPLSLLSRRR